MQVESAQNKIVAPSLERQNVGAFWIFNATDKEQANPTPTTAKKHHNADSATALRH